MAHEYLQGTLSGQLIRGYSAYEIAVKNGFSGTEEEWLASLRDNTGRRISSLTNTGLACGTVVEAVGIPIYVDDVSSWTAYGITETGWYVFSRIMAPDGIRIGDAAAVTGVAGYIAETGADHIDVAVQFGVAATSQMVIIDWDGGHTETFVFKATDLAVRNLDYRVTFYVYDADEFATWLYKRSEDAEFVGTKYYTEEDGVYTQAAVKAHEYVPADTYYTHAYVLSTDEVFQEGTVYYTLEAGVYTPAEVIAGDPLAPEGVDPAPVYYVDQWTLTTDARFVGTRYYMENDGAFEQIAVKAGDACARYTKVITYPLPGTTAFVGTEYYTESEGAYTRAAVLAGTEIPENTYYTHAYVLTTDTNFQAGTTYYTVANGVYTEATVTVGAKVTKNKYYVDQWTVAEGEFIGTAYYLEQNGEFVQAAVLGGDPIPAAYYTKVESYELAADEVFADGKTYYISSDGTFTAAEVVTGEEIPADTYYDQIINYPQATGIFAEGVTYYTAPAGVYTEAEVVPGETIPDIEYHVQLVSWPQATDAEYADGETYYTYLGGTYSEADVAAGDPIPVYDVHDKVIIDGLVRNITYRLNEIVDCPMEFILPEIEDDCHGAWFEIRCRHAGTYSMTLTPPGDDIKIATEHTQAETAGMNMINLHYTVVDGVKLWRFLNTHSSIPS